MDLSSVLGGEGSWWAAGELVEVHSEGEHQEALRDALYEPGECLGEVIFQAHLALEVGEHALDNQAYTCLEDLAGGSWTGTVALRCNEIDVDEFHAVAVLLAPESLVGKEHAAGVRGPLQS